MDMKVSFDKININCIKQGNFYPVLVLKIFHCKIIFIDSRLSAHMPMY